MVLGYNAKAYEFLTFIGVCYVCRLLSPLHSFYHTPWQSRRNAVANDRLARSLGRIINVVVGRVVLFPHSLDKTRLVAIYPLFYFSACILLLGGVVDLKKILFKKNFQHKLSTNFRPTATPTRTTTWGCVSYACETDDDISAIVCYYTRI